MADHQSKQREGEVTWELFLYPVIARYPETAFLLRDAVIKNDPAVLVFRISASATILIGIVLFCLAIYRSALYPKPAAAVIFVGAVVYALRPMISVFVSVAGIFTFALGCMLLGGSFIALTAKGCRWPSRRKCDARRRQGDRLSSIALQSNPAS